MRALAATRPRPAAPQPARTRAVAARRPVLRRQVARAATPGSGLPQLEIDVAACLYEPAGGQAPEFDVVLFHGLLPKETGYDAAWRAAWQGPSQGAPWPSAWLGPELQRARVLAVSYEAVCGSELPDAGDALVASLCWSQLGLGSRPVVLVAHCLGGLAAKHLCLAARRLAAQPHSLWSEAASRFCTNLRGAAFLASPHASSLRAGLPADLLDPSSSPFAADEAASSPLIKFFGRLIDEAPAINSSFRVAFPHLQLLGVAAQSPQAGAPKEWGCVVSPASAAQDMAGTVTVATDHSGLARPASASSAMHRMLSKYINDAALAPLAPVSSQVIAGLVADLEHRYDRDVAPSLELLRERKAHVDGYSNKRWGVSFGLYNKTDDINSAMEAAKVATAFWQAVADACEPLDGQAVLGDAFFTRTWAERARDYRLAVEPIDIADWYRAGRHIKVGHYDPMLADGADGPRPARYSLLQRQEERVLGAEPGYEVQSSLALAHALEQQLRSQSWAALTEHALKLDARTSF